MSYYYRPEAIIFASHYFFFAFVHHLVMFISFIGYGYANDGIGLPFPSFQARSPN